MTDLTERLRKRADEDARCAENSKVVADLLRPQLEAFEANEDQGNVYAIRMAVDHRNSVKRDGQYAADLREAATTLETLTQENARLREAMEAMLLYADPNGEGVYDGANDIVGVKQNGQMVLKGSFITTCIRARKALGGGE